MMMVEASINNTKINNTIFFYWDQQAVFFQNSTVEMKSFGSFPKAAPPVAAVHSSSSKRSAIDAPPADHSAKVKKQKKKNVTTPTEPKKKASFVICKTGDPVG
jgi:hypothetical protein